MLSTNIKTAWRALKKNRFYTIINVMGLAIATAAFLLIINYVRFEYSYENFYRNADNIYRITLDRYKGAEYVVTDCETHPPLGPLLKKDIPDVVDYVRIQQIDDAAEIKYRQKVFVTSRMYASDPSIFTIFNYDFKEGSPANALNEPFQAVLTASTAQKMFGDKPAKGEVIQFMDKSYTITGVIQDLPPNTHLKINMLISLSTLPQLGFQLNSWNGNNNYTYVQLRPHTSLTAFDSKMRTLTKGFIRDNIYRTEPVKDIHLFSHKTFEPEINGNIKTVRFLLITAFMILLVGSVNYINLTTARTTERTKEVGMRKALGASRGSLVRQFMMETLLINLFAMAIALLLVKLALPFYLVLADRVAVNSFFTSPVFWLICLALFVLNSLLSGIYPAMVLSAVKPVSITVKSFTASIGSALFRKTLVVGQFTAALVILSASFIVYRQLAFLRSQDLGLNPAELLVIKATSGEDDAVLEKEQPAFRQALQQLPAIQQASISQSLPGVPLNQLSTTTGISRYGATDGKGYNFYMYGIDSRLLDITGIKLVAGHNFRDGFPNKDEVIISREASRLLGFRTPETAVGQRISLTLSDSAKFSTIVGVTEDYHQLSMKESLLPMLHWYQQIGKYYVLKVSTAEMPATIAQIKSLWEQHFPGHTFEYQFMDQLFDQQYKADDQFGKVVKIFSALTLFITCLGILGLTAYNITRRTKEIGIRKVLGASVGSIVGLLSKDFVKLAMLAMIIATPLSWYIMQQWLQNFAYHMHIRWWMFAWSGLLTAGIAFVTACLQSVRAALMDPVKSLKTE
ncbi:FtsX-like permease family protein [Chitinophaga sp. Mgbs1]|uniref:FtsX-like permease family protein n=1 Tax=Chitinophaga solisilvae TaxID=1233460 RepID=A0A9Q5D265_9BACT|nr:FtsX-like permease family protein [Chitinophaga solisilvae]